MYDGPGMSEPTDEDNDDDLEHSEEEIREHFEKFWYDIVPEFKRFGEIEQLRVCRNHSHHLRGNVYIMYTKKEDAMRAHKAFHGRYYAGKKLLIQFSPVVNWKSAVCGLFTRRQCERGKQCNFLHVFSNPNGDLEGRDRDDRDKDNRDKDRDRDRDRDNPDGDRDRRRDRDRDTRDRDTRDRDRDRERKGSREREHRDRDRRDREEEPREHARKENKAGLYSSHGYKLEDGNEKDIERQLENQMNSDQHRRRHDRSGSPSDQPAKRVKRSSSSSHSSSPSHSPHRKKHHRH